MVQVSDVILRAQRRADMEHSSFLSPEEWLDLVSDSYADLYDLLVTRFDDYFVTGPEEFTVSSGTTAPLPADFYKLRALDKYMGGEWREVRRFNFNERNTLPTGTISGRFRYWYVPTPGRFESEDDEFSVYGWDRWIVADVARKALIKEESDPSALIHELAALETKIKDASQNRDLNEPGRIIDVTINQEIYAADVRYTVMGSNFMFIPWERAYRRRLF